MPIKQNKPFNPCPSGHNLCNPNDGNDKSCCPQEDPSKINNKNNIQSGPPKARSNIPPNFTKYNYGVRPTKNITRDIVVSGNRPIPKVKYAKDGTKRFTVNEKKRYKKRLNSGNDTSYAFEDNENDDRNPCPPNCLPGQCCRPSHYSSPGHNPDGHLHYEPFWIPGDCGVCTECNGDPITGEEAEVEFDQCGVCGGEGQCACGDGTYSCLCCIWDKERP
jgi:hypothetical protein